jgi:NADPH:quinone reductase-like Zn-dependent oxidoreductase
MLTMNAVRIHAFGGADRLVYESAPRPAPQAGEVLIRVRAAEVTKSDCELRSFHFPVKWFWLPLRVGLGITGPRRRILGGYFAGEIEAVGKDVSKLAAGDAVFGAAGLRLGAYAQYLCLPASYTIAPKPTNMSFEEAAAVPLGGLNALHFLRRADVRAGERVLINGAGGSIGTFGVQIAKHLGAEVTAVDSGIKESMLRRIGADHFVDYTRQDFTQAGQSYDVIFDMVARSSYAACVGTLNPGGRYLMANPRLSDMLRAVATTWLTDKRASFAFAGEHVEELLALTDLIEAGKLRSVVDQVYPMTRIAEAHTRVEREQRIGSVVLSLDA